MISKYSVAALIGSASSAAAVPGSLPPSSYPKYSDSAALVATTEKNVAGAVLASYATNILTSLAGPYQGFVNGLIVFPTQKILALTTGATDGEVNAVIAAGVSNSNTFWAQSETFLGSFATPSVTTDADTILASNASGFVFVFCATAATNSVCNGGIGFNKATTAQDHLIT